MRDGDLDLALDLTAEQAAELRKDVTVPLPSDKTTSNRRVYFLAVNHRKPGLDNANLRIALARAIPREALLDDHFRKGLDRKVHKALNGPYPAGSWACNPSLVSRKGGESLDPHDEALAQTKLKQALGDLRKREVKLTLKYPSGDAQVAAAMQALCERVNKALPGVTLVAEERSPYDLREDVERTHAYELAYYHHDYPDETFWLYPLLGSSGRGGGEHYLGPIGGESVRKVLSATDLRDFADVKDRAHTIHRQLLEVEMPLIPLWQLDPLYAYRKEVVALPGPIVPQRVFTRVEEWRVRRR